MIMPKSNSTKLFSVILLLWFTPPVMSSEKIPLPISLYPNAKSIYDLQWDYGSYEFITDIDQTDQSKIKRTSVSGDLFLNRYEIQNVSSVKVYENYKNAIENAGFTIAYECKLEECGSKKQAQEMAGNMIPGRFAGNYYHNPYYLYATKDGKAGAFHIAWFIGAYDDEVWVQQVLLQSEPLELGLVSIDVQSLGEPILTKPATDLTAKEKAKDHPLLPRYPGARVERFITADSETIEIPSSSNTTESNALHLTGDLARHTYEIPDVSTLKVYQNYLQALQEAQFEIINRCELDNCVEPKEFGGKISITGSVFNYYHKPYYLLTRRSGSQGDVYIALFIGGYNADVRLNQIILEEQAVTTGLVEINDEILKQQLDQQGKALIYGIYFDSGKSVIKPESKNALDAIAALLTKNPDLLLYVVGHTDDTGALSNNIQLSQARARSVVSALTQDYAIAPDKLLAEGVGPYAPAANNINESGRQENRRVELVKRLN